MNELERLFLKELKTARFYRTGGFSFQIPNTPWALKTCEDLCHNHKVQFKIVKDIDLAQVQVILEE